MYKSIAGLTLIELTVVVAILGITLNVAMPSFSAMLDRNRSATHVNEFMTALNLARNEALRVGGIVSVQALDPSDTNNEFGKGWCVVEGNPGTCNGAVIREFAAISDGATLDSIENANSIQFNNVGELDAGSIQNIDLCTASNANRRIFVALVGRSKSYRATDAVVNRRPACS